MKKFALFCIVCFTICNVAFAEEDTSETNQNHRKLCENGQYLVSCNGDNGGINYDECFYKPAESIICRDCEGTGAVTSSMCEKNGDTITCDIKTEHDCSLLNTERTDSTGTFKYQTNADINCAYSVSQ